MCERAGGELDREGGGRGRAFESGEGGVGEERDASGVSAGSTGVRRRPYPKLLTPFGTPRPVLPEHR